MRLRARSSSLPFHPANLSGLPLGVGFLLSSVPRAPSCYGPYSARAQRGCVCPAFSFHAVPNTSSRSEAKRPIIWEAHHNSTTLKRPRECVAGIPLARLREGTGVTDVKVCEHEGNDLGKLGSTGSCLGGGLFLGGARSLDIDRQRSNLGVSARNLLKQGEDTE